MISHLKEEDIEKVVLISDKLVGENFHTYESFKKYLSDPHKIVSVYKVDNEIVGFAKGKVIDKTILKEKLFKTDTNIEEELTGSGNLGFVETICVSEEFRGKRIGKELADELIESFKKTEHINAIYTTVWKTGETENAKKLVKNLGFKYITEITEYWYKDSIDKNYICPKCGNPPCKCSMVFYKL